MTDNRKFVDDALKAHNEYRKRHGVKPLKHTKEITAVAQKWADHLASTGSFQHSGEGMGENIAMKWTSGGDDFTGQQVTNQWYSEVSKYNFNHGGGSGTGHFTQVVWKDSKEFGIGRAKGRDGKWIVVGNYEPPGNFNNRYQENVFPSKDGKTSLIGDDAPSGGGSGAAAKKGPTSRPFVSFQKKGFHGNTPPPAKHTQQVSHHGYTTPQHCGITTYQQPKPHVHKYQITTSTPSAGRCGVKEVHHYTGSHDSSPGFSSGFKGFPESDSHSSGFSRGGFKGFSGFDSGFDSGARGGRHDMAFPSSGFDTSSSSSSSGGRVVSTETRTVTEGSGANRKTKTIVTETIVEPDGTRKTVTKETIKTGN